MTNQSSKDNQLLIYSDLAKRLIRGRKGDKTNHQYPIYGLLQFAGKVTIIWRDAQQGNPYGRWYLVRIDRVLDVNQEALTQFQQRLVSLANDDTGLDYQPALGKPFSLTMHFSTPYPWMVMRQIKQFDTLLLLSKKLNRVGLLPREEFQSTTRHIHRLITAGFNQIMKYRSFELTLEGVYAMSATSKQANRAMGMVPPGIINGKLQPAFSPQGLKQDENSA